MLRYRRQTALQGAL